MSDSYRYDDTIIIQTDYQCMETEFNPLSVFEMSFLRSAALNGCATVSLVFSYFVLFQFCMH